MIRVAICDSQITTAEKIKDILETIYHGGIGITVCESNFALQNYVLDEMRGDVDILFLGIQLPDSSGILSAVEIQKSYPNIQIAFVAEDGKAAQEIFSANPSYFLMKPIEKDKIQDAMNRMVVNIHKNSRQVLTFESKKGVYAFPMDEILYIESDRRELVFVMTGNRRESGYGKLDDLMQKLPPQFLRCHQSYIVNMDKLSFFPGGKWFY